MQSLPTVAANAGLADVTMVKPRLDPTSTPRQWYACADELELALRIAPGAMFGENADGELVLVPDEAVHAAGFDIIGEQLWLNPIAGTVTVDDRPAQAAELMQAGARIEIGDVRFRVSQGISDVDNQPAAAGKPDDTVQLPPSIDQSTRPRLVEPLEIVDQATGRNLDLTIDRTRDRNAEITRIIRVAETTHRTPSQAAHAAQGHVAHTTVRVSTRLKSQTKRIYQSTAVRVVSAGVAATIGLLLAGAYAGRYLELGNDAEPGVIAGSTAGMVQTQSQPGIVLATVPASSQHPQSPTGFQSTPPVTGYTSTLSATADSPEGQISDLITLVQAAEVTVPNNDRVLSLVAALQPTPHRLKAMTYLRLWKIRLLETTNLTELEQMADTFRAIAEIGDLRVALDERTQTLAQLKALNKQARDLYIAGDLHVPGANSVVSVASEMLTLDPTSRDALTWQRRAADALVIEARDLIANNREYEARNLVEEILDFNPNHPNAVELWNVLVERT